MSQKFRVIQWAPGLVGKMALKQIIDHPALELAGLWVHSPDKVGLDAGDFCGADKTGVAASADVERILAIDADCVSYMATDQGGRELGELVDDIARILASGKNVVGVQGSMGMPSLHGPEVLAQLGAACRTGRSSYCPTGINAVGSQAVLAALATTCRRVDSTSLCELYNFETYEDPDAFRWFGFGLSPEETESTDLQPLFMSVHGPGLHITAHWFGQELDEIRWQQEFVFAPNDIETRQMKIKAGTANGLHIVLDGCVEGESRVVQENYYWLGDYPREWRPPPGDGGYRITIRGEPDMEVEWATRTRNESHGGFLARERHPQELAFMGALMATAARAINSIPEVCRSAPGIVTVGDPAPLLPPVNWRHSLR